MNTKSRLLFAVLLVMTTGGRAVSFGTALSVAGDTSQPMNEPATVGKAGVSIPRSVSFREVSGRGLLIRAWVNGVGPFNFAVDTGAGATLLSERVADEARVGTNNGRPTSIAGLSGAPVYARVASVQNLAIGDPENYLPAKGEVMVTGGLPRDLDGVLDPTEAF